MKIKQVSVFAQNEQGRLLAILKALEDTNINLRAISVSENVDFGIVRMIMDDPEKGSSALKQAGFTERTDTMLTAEIPDVPNGLLKAVIQPLSESGVNVEYFYAFLEQKVGTARIVLKTSDDEKAEAILRN
ncbi:MAG: amino acid-binding protein [Dehalococcoidia bacterium]|nr:amino acid-binding protein [Dehalococcoidia bacterium]